MILWKTSMCNNQLLSVCISSYNKSAKCVDLINKLIDLNDDRLTVVICDDCSDDETWIILKGINKDRVIIHRNQDNLGACPNWYETINHGMGQYILHVLDRDYIDAEMIVLLMDYLEKNTVGAGYLGNYFHGVHLDVAEGEIKCYHGGEETVAELGCLPFHPTGFFVNKNEWKKGDFKKYFYDEKQYGIYPHSYVLSIIAMNADIALMPGSFCKHVFTLDDRSGFYDKKKRDYWWEPSYIYKTSIKMVEEICSLFVDSKYRNAFVSKCFKSNLSRATLRYRLERSDKNQMCHYGLKPQNITKTRLLLINLIFLFKYYFFQIQKGVGCYGNINRFVSVAKDNRRMIVENTSRSQRTFDKLEDENKKFKEFYQVFCRWMRIGNKGKSIRDYLSCCGYKNIAIYGMREMGILLCDELLAIDELQIRCCIDKGIGGSYKSIPIVSLEDIPDDIDVIIVTAVHYYNEIKSELSRNVSCHVVSIEDVIWGQ